MTVKDKLDRIIKADPWALPQINPNLGVMPEKKRFLYQQLVDFIEDKDSVPIALIAGLRQTGKTTLLRQLEEQYGEDAVYIDLSLSTWTLDKLQDYFLDGTKKVILLDEIVYLRDYEPISQAFFNLLSKSEVKVVMTGSSPFHIIKLSRTKLGGRCKLFKLPLLTFIEYLYFTDKIPSYDDYSLVTNDYFKSYLTLEDVKGTLAERLVFTFNVDYLSSLYEEVAIGDKYSQVRGSAIQLRPDDLRNLINIIAYKLGEAQDYEATFAPTVGGQEQIHLFQQKVKVKLADIDFTETSIAASLESVSPLQVKDLARLLVFMLWSGLTVVEHNVTASHESPSYSEILERLAHASKTDDLTYALKNTSLCLVSPIFYSYLGAELLETMKVNHSLLNKGMLFGKMLEVYIRGATAMLKSDTILTSKKLSDVKIGDVDIFDGINKLLLEVSSWDKGDNENFVHAFFTDHKFVRVCTSENKDYFSERYQYYQIPYAKLCCMVDTGDILKLKRTSLQH